MDREAEFRRLYEAHRAAVHAYFTGRTGDPQSAADLMQDVFLRVWQHLEKLTEMPYDRQRAWIFTVARNLSVDAHRHQRTQAGTEQALAHERGRPPQSASTAGGTAASTAVIAAERVAVVGEAIRRLPEPQRVTLTMAAAGGMTSAELAAALGVPAGTVRYRLSLARRAVAEALDRYDDPTET
jgi:RNA polymerase sigma-70 factor (ECF subfamily)